MLTMIESLIQYLRWRVIIVIIKDLLCLSCSSLLISLNILWYWQLLFES